MNAAPNSDFNAIFGLEEREVPDLTEIFDNRRHIDIGGFTHWEEADDLTHVFVDPSGLGDTDLELCILKGPVQRDLLQSILSELPQTVR